MNVKLKPREMQVTKLVACGLKSKEIGNKLGIKEDTVKNDLRSIFDKCGVWNRLELALWYIKNYEYN